MVNDHNDDAPRFGHTHTLSTLPWPSPPLPYQFVTAAMARWPNAVLQFEDFSIEHAGPLLERYRKHHLVFNDDIQVRPDDWRVSRKGT